jgi:hypothetical protein
MPLSEDEFDAGEEGRQRTVLWFLREHATTAYTADEILFELDYLGFSSSRDEVATALEALISARRILTRQIAGEIYYKCDRRIGFKPPEH